MLSSNQSIKNQQTFVLGHINDYIVDKPYKITYNNQDYVLWKTKDNHISIISNICPHRLAPLSNGHVCTKRGTIVCPYHNFEFDSQGDWIYELDDKGVKTYISKNIKTETPSKTELHNNNSLKFEVIKGWIVVGANLTLPKEFESFSFDGEGKMTSIFNYELTSPLVDFVENLVDVDHFIGTHTATFLTHRVTLDSFEADDTKIKYNFTSYYKSEYTLLEKIKTPFSYLYPKFAEQGATLTKNSFVFDTKKYGVKVLIAWYPKNNSVWNIRIAFYETGVMNPLVRKYFNKGINSVREQAINEDLNMMKSLYQDSTHSLAKIKVPNDAPLKAARKIISDML